jgi:hypothetical protein
MVAVVVVLKRISQKMTVQWVVPVVAGQGVMTVTVRLEQPTKGVLVVTA